MSFEYRIATGDPPPRWVVSVADLGDVDLRDHSCSDFTVSLEVGGTLYFADHTRSDLSARVLRRALDLCLAHSTEVRISEP